MFQEAASESTNFLGLSDFVWTVILVPITLGVLKIIQSIVEYYKSKNNRSNKSGSGQQVNVTVNEAIKKVTENSSDTVIITDAVVLKNIGIRDLLVSKLSAIREEIDADRVWIGKFHNGDDNQFYPSKRSMQMFTIIQDAVRSGVSHKNTVLYQIPVVFYETHLNKTLKDGYWISENTETLEPSHKKIYEQQGVKSTCSVPVYNKFKQMVGVLGVDYIKQTQITMNIIEILQNRAIFLEDHLKEYMIYSDKYIRENS